MRREEIRGKLFVFNGPATSYRKINVDKNKIVSKYYLFSIEKKEGRKIIQFTFKIVAKNYVSKMLYCFYSFNIKGAPRPLSDAVPVPLFRFRLTGIVSLISYCLDF